MAGECYSVELDKGEFGLGIYFAAGAGGCAAVDASVPFYRLPDGELAPGEASGVIAPGDALLKINDVHTEHLELTQVVEELRAVPQGQVRLTFRRGQPGVYEVDSQQTGEEGDNRKEEEEEEQDEEEPMKEEEVGATASMPSTPSSKSWGMLQRLSFSSNGGKTSQSQGRSDQDVDRVHDLEVALERERKCRFLAEKKNILYRNELLRVSQENSVLRDQLARATDDLRRLEIFAQRNLHLAI